MNKKNVARRGFIIHQFPPAYRVKASRTTQDTVNQEDTQGHPQRAQANHRTATPPTPTSASAHWNQSPPAKIKAWQTAGEHQWGVMFKTVQEEITNYKGHYEQWLRFPK